MYIDGDTHYWPLRFIDKVSHPGKGHIEITPDTGDYLRYGHSVPGKVATYYRDGKKIHSFKEGRWSIALRAEFMKKDGFDIQVLIPDNRPLIYECDPELGRQLARAYNDTVAEDYSGRRPVHRRCMDLSAGHQGIRKRTAAGGQRSRSESREAQRRLGRRRSRQ